MDMVVEKSGHSFDEIKTAFVACKNDSNPTPQQRDLMEKVMDGGVIVALAWQAVEADEATAEQQALVKKTLRVLLEGGKKGGETIKNIWKAVEAGKGSDEQKAFVKKMLKVTAKNGKLVLDTWKAWRVGEATAEQQAYVEMMLEVADGNGKLVKDAWEANRKGTASAEQKALVEKTLEEGNKGNKTVQDAWNDWRNGEATPEQQALVEKTFEGGNKGGKTFTSVTLVASAVRSKRLRELDLHHLQETPAGKYTVQLRSTAFGDYELEHARRVRNWLLELQTKHAKSGKEITQLESLQCWPIAKMKQELAKSEVQKIGKYFVNPVTDDQILHNLKVKWFNRPRAKPSTAI